MAESNPIHEAGMGSFATLTSSLYGVGIVEFGVLSLNSFLQPKTMNPIPETRNPSLGSPVVPSQ